MKPRDAHPFLCTANSCEHLQQFVCLKQIIHHPLFNEDEKYLWLWLSLHCTQEVSFSCSYSYEHLSHIVNQSCRMVHRTLFRLKTMGFLRASLPIWYNKLTPEMETEVRTYQIILR